MIKTKKKQTELGRSMVEMLGVLAVIGVLTIGGLAGYNYAINKNIADNIINEINLRVQTVSMQMETANVINFSELGDKILEEYPVSVETDPANKRFVLTVSDIPEEPLKRMIADKFGGLKYWAVGINSDPKYVSVQPRKVLASQATGNVLVKSALADLNEKNMVWFEFFQNIKATPEFPTDEIKKLGTEYSRCVYSE